MEPNATGQAKQVRSDSAYRRKKHSEEDMIADADQDGVTIGEWLETLSEKDRQKLIDRLMREPPEERS
jgi:hypothetical protein